MPGSHGETPPHELQMDNCGIIPVIACIGMRVRVQGWCAWSEMTPERYVRICGDINKQGDEDVANL